VEGTGTKIAMNMKWNRTENPEIHTATLTYFFDIRIKIIHWGKGMLLRKW
jgi:hypothetical protein